MCNHVRRNYKDSLFLMIFRDKPALLRLYNAIRGSNYTDPDALTVTTIENVLYLGMKNDISFIIGNELNLYEAQSTWNPNMPLRGLFYFAKLYQGYIAEHEMNIYATSLVQLPIPRYVVLYNGSEKSKDYTELRLSDAFPTIPGENPCLECVATIININYGHNQELMKNCHELYEYAYLVEEVRKGTRSGLSLADSIDQAVETCIEHNVLKEFLLRHRAEVKNTMLEELYSVERYERLLRQEGYRKGKAEGLAEGRAAEIVQIGLEFGLSDKKILERLQTKLEISLPTAEEYLSKFAPAKSLE